MKLYVTYTSPYARLARIVVIEKALEERVEIIEAKTRAPGQPLLSDQSLGPCTLSRRRRWRWHGGQPAYLRLSRRPRRQASLPQPALTPDWAYLRLESSARSLCDGISVWAREMGRPETSARLPCLPMRPPAPSAWRIFLKAIWPTRR